VNLAVVLWNEEQDLSCLFVVRALIKKIYTVNIQNMDARLANGSSYQIPG
jgi:hypothetical protein